MLWTHLMSMVMIVSIICATRDEFTTSYVCQDLSRRRLVPLMICNHKFPL